MYLIRKLFKKIGIQSFSNNHTIFDYNINYKLYFLTARIRIVKYKDLSDIYIFSYVIIIYNKSFYNYIEENLSKDTFKAKLARIIAARSYIQFENKSNSEQVYKKYKLIVDNNIRRKIKLNKLK